MFDANRKKLLVIGNGPASQRLLDELLRLTRHYQITVLSNESVPGYNRIMLSTLLAGESITDDITMHHPDWYQSHGIDLRLSCPAENIDSKQQQVRCRSGEIFAYDKLVIATGSKALIPDIPGARLKGVTGFRNITDVNQMLGYCKHRQTPKRAVVVGAGLLGIEAAAGLRKQGMDVTLLHRNTVLMNRQLDNHASLLLEQQLKRRGIEILKQVHVQSLHGTHQLRSVKIREDDGKQRTLDADLLVFTTGTTPVTVLVNDAEQTNHITVNQAIVVNSKMQTSVSNIYALGECMEFEGNTYGLVAPIWKQASVLANILAGFDDNYQEPAYVTKLKVSGMDVHCMGIPDFSDNTESLTLSAPSQGIYKRLVLHKQKIIAAILVGDIRDSHWYFELMQKQASVAEIRKQLVFGKAFVSSPASEYVISRLDSAA
jgi:nitrite reductase (NADH) large subunit